MKVYLRAYKPSTSNIIVYYKVLSAGDSESFDDKYWIKMSQVTDSNLFSSNDNDFQTFEFKHFLVTIPYKYITLAHQTVTFFSQNSGFGFSSSEGFLGGNLFFFLSGFSGEASR